MQYPKLRQPAQKVQTVSVFGGYNHNLRIGDGEWYDMKNMSSDGYPVLMPREKRGTYYQSDQYPIKGMVNNGGLCFAKGASFFVTSNKGIAMGLDVYTDKTFVNMGVYTLILPERKWINIGPYRYQHPGYESEEQTWGDIDSKFRMDAGPNEALWAQWGIYPCKSDGTDYGSGAISTEKPGDPEDGQLWLDTSQEPHALKRWAESSGMWLTVATTYVKICCTEIGKGFEEGDGILISGLDGTKAETLNGTAVIHKKADDYLVVTGLIDQIVTGEELMNKPNSDLKIEFTRRMPDMQFVTESGNRIWGCYFGASEKGPLNEIYCSKLGDFKNWNCFQGVATDSYVASVGVDGPFTGAATYLGRPIFFKENCIIEVYGSYPAQFQMQTTQCSGVQRGSEKSIAVVGNVLYYKGTDGVYAFDGSLPVNISPELGGEPYFDAVACGYGSKYYICMRHGQTLEYHLFVYDTRRRLWHREDDLRARAFCQAGGKLYCVPGEEKQIITIGGFRGNNGEQVDWMVQSGEIGLSLPEGKYLSRLDVRLSVAPGATVSVYAAYDQEPGWELVYTVTGTDLRSFSVPIRPRQCDHMKLKLEGVGEAKLYALTKTWDEGGSGL